ncbi:hypothetical protein SAY86_028610 [Trapa natans]|uniref:TF-B3 domain-containing protein n=1 Tax=Trapa natans TaxID=22666 RepID=A0AAN7M0W5_TRANT|nr:hypothetical protein SAY86_028610 [Trapa natans]
MGDGGTCDLNMPSGRLPHFFEIYSYVSSSKRLKIPVNFTKHIEGKESGLVSLEGPSGNTWQVELIHETGSLSLHCGWSTFVRDNSILCGDLLVFRYNGNLHFSVQIFDKTACEKEVAFYAKCSQDPSDHGYGYESGERQKDDATHCLKSIYDAMPNKTTMCQIPDDERYWIEDVSTVTKHKSLNSLAEAIIPLRSVSSNGKFDVKNGAINERELDLPSSSHILRSSSAEEKRIARSFTSPFPYFVRIMKKFNISGSYTLNIPYKFSMEHLPNCRITIVLSNLKGERWTVNSVPTTKVHTSHTFCGGWMAFVRGNGIKLEDICVFELVHKSEMRVHILAGHATSDENERRASNVLAIISSEMLQEDSNGIKRKKRESMEVNLQGKVKNHDKKSLKTSLAGTPTGMKKHTNASKSSAGRVCLYN